MHQIFEKEYNSTSSGKTYLRIIINALNENRNRSSGIFELHHILPKAKNLFPQYASLKEYSWNGVLLTPREHFICHGLLTQHYRKTSETKKYRSMSRAFFTMSNTNTLNSRLYEHIKLDLLQGVGTKPEGFNKGTNNPRAKIIYIYNDKKELIHTSHGNFREVLISNKFPMRHFSKILKEKIYSFHPQFQGWCVKEKDTSFEEIEKNTYDRLYELKSKPKYKRSPASKESKEKMKTSQRGFSTYRTNEGVTIRARFDDVRVLSGELISVNAGVGYKHKLDLIQVRKNAILGEKNPCAKKIIIYDSSNNIRFECIGSFRKVCKENNLPFTAFQESYLSGGKKLYENSSGNALSKISNNGNIKYKNWYAKIENQ